MPSSIFASIYFFRFNLDPGNDNDEAVPRKAQQIMTFSKIGLRSKKQ